jgi:hypothetical protein
MVTVMQELGETARRVCLQIETAQWELCCSVPSVDRLRACAAAAAGDGTSWVIGELRGVPVALELRAPRPAGSRLRIGPLGGEWLEIAMDPRVTDELLLAIRSVLDDLPGELS